MIVRVFFIASVLTRVCPVLAEVPLQPLFEANEPLELLLIADLRALVDDTSNNPEYRVAQLVHIREGSNDHFFDLKIRPRGGTRRLGGLCTFPPLMFNFKKEAVRGTVFENQDKLKFVSQCRQESVYADYLLQEYLVYRTYNIITEESYRVCRVSLTLRDIHDPLHTFQMDGFFIEDDDMLEKRLGATAVSGRSVVTQDSCIAEKMLRFALFQYMIGNTDWHVKTFHNTDLYRYPDNRIFPVPFDFDCAGIINTEYAKPSQMLPITDVRQRYFKGSCADTVCLDQELSRLFECRQSIYDLYSNSEFLNRRMVRKSLEYYDAFFELVQHRDADTPYPFCLDIAAAPQ